MGTADRHSDHHIMPLTLLESPARGADLWSHPFIVAALERRHPGLVLKAWREAHWPACVTQADLAKRLGVAQSTLCEWETRPRPRHTALEWDDWFDVIGAPRWARWWLDGIDN